VSDHITVRSIIGRFLEHSRIYWFVNGGRPKVFIGSADLMERSLDRRVEVLCPVIDQSIADHLRSVVLAACLRDGYRGRVLTANGTYERDNETADESLSSQDVLLAGYLAEGKEL
jgi:polyphosphate kinase